MESLSVFVDLEKRNIERYLDQVEMNSDPMLKSLCKIIALQETYSEPTDDIGERLKEALEKNIKIGSYERSLALEYLQEDYINSMNYAKKYLHDALKQGPEARSHYFNLRRAMQLTLRALRDVRTAVKIDIQYDLLSNGITTEKRLSYINRLLAKVYAIMDSPYSYYKVLNEREAFLDLKHRLKQAVADENYEKAIILRDNLAPLRL